MLYSYATHYSGERKICHSLQIEKTGIISTIERFNCICGEEVTYVRRSENDRIPHFRHQPNSVCKFKNILPNYTKEHEKYIDYIINNLEFLNLSFAQNYDNIFKLSIIPDLILSNSKGDIIVVELQNSHKDKSYISQKTIEYSSIGFYTLWIFTDNVNANSEQVSIVPSPSFLNSSGFIVKLLFGSGIINANWSPNVTLFKYKNLLLATLSKNSILFTLNQLTDYNIINTRNFKMSVPQFNYIRYVKRPIHLNWRPETLKKNVHDTIEKFKADEFQRVGRRFLIIPLFVLRPFQNHIEPTREQIDSISDYIIYPKKSMDEYCELYVETNKIHII